MTNKTKEFKLNESTLFKNEIIRFFNINPYNSSIYISLEINGKKIKLNNASEKIILKDIITQNENSEINYNVSEDIDLKMQFKIINKFNKKEIFESFQTKMRESKARWKQSKVNEGKVFGHGISIKDRVKMFSGGDNTKKHNNPTNYKPGKLKIPTMFQKSNQNSIKSSNSNLSTNLDESKNSINNRKSKDSNKLEIKEKIIKNEKKIENDNNNEKIIINNFDIKNNNDNKNDNDLIKNIIVENKNNNNEDKIGVSENINEDIGKIEAKEIKEEIINKNEEEIKENAIILNENKNKINEQLVEKSKEILNNEIENNKNKDKNEEKFNNNINEEEEEKTDEPKNEEKEDEVKKEEEKKDEQENEEGKTNEVKNEEEKKDELENEEGQKDKLENDEEEKKDELKNKEVTENHIEKIKEEDNVDIEKIKCEENNIIVNDNLNSNSKEVDKFDENYLYEEREDVSNEENGEDNSNDEENEKVNIESQINNKEKEDQNNKIDDNCININNEIEKAEKINTNNNPKPLAESITFHKDIPEIDNLIDENVLKFQNASKNFGSSMTFHQKPKGTPSFKTNSGDVFLESINYTSYLKSLQKKGLKESKRETFCEGFFIASFPTKNATVIEKSQSFPASCGHEECSKLPSMKPEIIKRYPLKDTKKLEMNNLAASLCFPTGIKVCYSENNPSNIKDYVTPITNQKGDRYYMMTHHFYRKISRDEFIKKYEMHPLKYHLQKFGDAYLSLSEEELNEEKVNEIQTSLEFCQELGFRDNLYIPYCLCIISKYPYVNEIKKCLKSIYRILSKEKLISYLNPEDGYYEINNLIMHLIHSVPIPDPNSMVKFFLPYYNKRIEITCPKIEDISIMNANTCTLLKVFSVEHIITIYKLIINEKKLLFIDKYYDRLAKVTDGFISLLYPLQWIHTYIPIMSDQMLKYLETFLPFLNGVHDSLIPLIKKIFIESDIDEELFLIYINDDKIKLGTSLNGKKKMKTEKYIQEYIPSFPSDLEKKLKNKLKKLKSEYSGGQKNESKMENERAELKMRDAFIEFFVGMFHDYEKYLYLLDDQDVIFNKSLFLSSVPNNEKKFYEEIIDSQLFQQFTQNIIKEDFNYLYKKLALRELENNTKKEKDKKKKKGKNKEEEEEEIKSKILYNYVVSPNYLNIKETDVRNIENKLRQKYPIAIKEVETERIANDLAEIESIRYLNDSCLIYLTPEQIKAEKAVTTENKNLDLRKSAIPRFTGKIMDMKIKMNVKISTKGTMLEAEKFYQKRKDEIKEYIRDFAAKIFKSEINNINIDNTEKSDLMNLIENSYGRECFINLLSHNKGNMVLLQYDSFKLLGNLIYNTIIGTLKIEETDKVLEEMILLIKSTKYFGTEEKGKTITIFDDYKKKIQSTPKIVQYNFWKKTYDMDLNSKENKEDSHVKQQIIYEIVSSMIELEIPKSLVKTITEKISNEVFGKDSQLTKETFKVFIQQITKAHYISKARI